MSHKQHFKRFFEAQPDRVHFAAHSHHFWPDVSYDAHCEAWMDAARLADNKWEKIFGEIWPRAQAHVARILGLPDKGSIAFGPSVHAFLVRILSCLPRERPMRILTTDGEFHSFSRQMARLEEDKLAVVTRVATEPFATFAARFASAARAENDLVYVSHAFFDSGYVIDLVEIVSPIRADVPIVIDGYHGFLVVPTSLGKLASRIFYTGGGYKYAMTGEGACFLHCPPGVFERPLDTGWFSAFTALKGKQDGVPYGEGGARFLGATFDPTPLYRFVAVMDWLVSLGLGPAEIRAHTRRMQAAFMREIQKHKLPLTEAALVVPLAEENRGQFLTFRLGEAKSVHDALMRANVITDVRGDRLRFGFALYHDEEDMAPAAARIARALS